MQYQALFNQNMKPNLSSAAVLIGDLKIYFQDHLWPEFPQLLQNAHQGFCCYSDEIKAPTKRQQTTIFMTFPSFSGHIRLDISCESSAGRRFTWTIRRYLLLKGNLSFITKCRLLRVLGGMLRVKIIIPLFFGLKNLICPSLRPFIAVHGTEVAELKSFQPITENVLLNSEMPRA